MLLLPYRLKWISRAGVPRSHGRGPRLRRRNGRRSGRRRCRRDSTSTTGAATGAARIPTGSMCMPFQSPGKMAAPWFPRHPDAVAGVELRARRNQLQGLAERPELRAHHRGIAPGISPVARMTASASSSMVPPSGALRTSMPSTRSVVRHHEIRRRAAVAEFHAGLRRSLAEGFDDGAAAADRLDAGRPGGEIIDWRDEFDAVALQPCHGRRRVLRQRARK